MRKSWRSTASAAGHCFTDLAGEAIFTLPYHVTRFFRPTFLEFSTCPPQSWASRRCLWLCGMVAYFVGGPLADRFEPRKPLAGSLWATALGGLYLATFPSVAGVTLVWGFFGMTNILFFYAALIKATRWGGDQRPCLWFAGWRSGLLGSLLSACSPSLLPSPWATTPPRCPKKPKYWQVIYGYTAVTAAVGFVVWFTLRGLDGEQTGEQSAPISHFFRQIKHVIRLRVVWLQSTVLICA